MTKKELIQLQKLMDKLYSEVYEESGYNDNAQEYKIVYDECEYTIPEESFWSLECVSILLDNIRCGLKEFHIVFHGYTPKYGDHVTVCWGREHFRFKDLSSAKDFIKLQTRDLKLKKKGGK